MTTMREGETMTDEYADQFIDQLEYFDWVVEPPDEIAFGLSAVALVDAIRNGELSLEEI